MDYPTRCFVTAKSEAVLGQVLGEHGIEMPEEVLPAIDESFVGVRIQLEPTMRRTLSRHPSVIVFGDEPVTY
jgi:hypothetical protein